MSSAERVDDREQLRLLTLPKGGQADTARQFLPAALEILETPASPVGRAIGATIILFFSIAIAWAQGDTGGMAGMAPHRGAEEFRQL